MATDSGRFPLCNCVWLALLVVGSTRQVVVGGPPTVWDGDSSAAALTGTLALAFVLLWGALAATGGWQSVVQLVGGVLGAALIGGDVDLAPGGEMILAVALLAAATAVAQIVALARFDAAEDEPAPTT